MIRLSEALARVHCEDKIYPEYVKEAEKLLSNSILKIDRPDIQADEPQNDDDLNLNKDAPNIIVRKRKMNRWLAINELFLG